MHLDDVFVWSSFGDSFCWISLQAQPISLFGLVLVIHFVGFLHKHNQYLLKVSIVLVEHGVEASKFLEMPC
jgi:hypothetical protein